MYAYIYIEREREIICICMCVCVFVYIYIYVYEELTRLAETRLAQNTLQYIMACQFVAHYSM